MKLGPVQYGLQKAWQDTVLLLMYGRYKDYVACRKNLASKAVRNFEEYISVPKVMVKVPLFSKEGFNIFTATVKDLFRRKTPDEKLFKKMLFEEKVKQKLQRGLYV